MIQIFFIPFQAVVFIKVTFFLFCLYNSKHLILVFGPQFGINFCFKYINLIIIIILLHKIYQIIAHLRSFRSVTPVRLLTLRPLPFRKILLSQFLRNSIHDILSILLKPQLPKRWINLIQLFIIGHDLNVLWWLTYLFILRLVLIMSG